MSEICGWVVDVQILMIASGKSSPPDDGSGAAFLNTLRDCAIGRLVWDGGGMIREQYERKLGETTFAREWLGEMLLGGKVIEVDRARLARRASVAIRDTGLVGEDLNLYVRTAANNPDKHLVSQDSDYDAATRAALKKHLEVRVHSAHEASGFLQEREDAAREPFANCPESEA